jgi:hypothetical protein
MNLKHLSRWLSLSSLGSGHVRRGAAVADEVFITRLSEVFTDLFDTDSTTSDTLESGRRFLNARAVTR